MSAQDLVGLIEEMIEIKVRQHATAEAKHQYPGNRELARVVHETSAADRERLRNVRQMLVQVLEGA
jgi:hypothetical protein